MSVLRRVTKCIFVKETAPAFASSHQPQVRLSHRFSPSIKFGFHKVPQSRLLTTSSATEMRAQVLEKFNTPYAFKDIPKPADPEGTDILIQVHAASYCHTDAVFASGAMWQDLPRVGSHEFAGEVVALGSDVSPSLGLKVGTKVGVPGRAYKPCGTCYECTDNDGDPEK